ncbi:MAG: S-layer homology domain-containing protein [Thermoanaerobacteraceae bacterium]|nr:S-layer homology domain-containing protein [Thermoanaerobacteraceae bacterium]
MRYKRGLILVLTVLLTLSLIGTAFAAPPQWVQEKKMQKMFMKQFKARFRDLTEHWAAEAVERMSAKGYISGYGDGTFKPQAFVTNEQALAMIVRAVYPGAEVDQEEVFFNMEKLRQLSSTWAMHELAVAIDKQLTTAEEMFSLVPRKPARRIDVARYIARALLKGDIDPADVELDFIDVEKLDKDDLAMLEKVVALGIFQGDPSKTFRPFKPITRAEMAVLLKRLDEKVENERDKAEIKGILKAIDIDDLEITITADGEDVTYNIAEDASVFRNNKRAGLEDLEIGDEVLVVLSEDGAVKFIGARKVIVKEKVEGKVVGIDSGDNSWIKVMVDGHSYQYYLADEVDVEIDGEEAELDEINVGDYVILKVENQLVVAVEVELEEREVEGIIEDIEDDEITVLVDDEEQTFRLADNVKVKIDGEEAGVEDLTAGGTAELEVVGDLVVEIKVEYEEEVAGTFLKMDGDEITVLVDDEEVTYPLAENVDIDIEAGINLEEVPGGVEVTLELRNGKVVRLEIEVTEREITGAIEDVDDGEITVLVDDEEQTFRLADNVKVKIDGEEAGVEDLTAGGTAELEVVGDLVVEIKVEYEEEVAGTFLKMDGDEITVLVDDEEVTYPLAENVDIDIEGDADLTKVLADSEVELELKGGKVVKLKIEVEEE